MENKKQSKNTNSGFKKSGFKTNNQKPSVEINNDQFKEKKPDKIITQNHKGEDIIKKVWNPFPALAPVPVVLVTCKHNNKDNIITIGWTGIVCSKPPMLYISVRKERFSYELIEKSGEFVVNLTTQKMVRATDLCGVRSGKNIDKFKECNLTRQQSATVDVPSIAQSPVNLECSVVSQTDFGSHTMFVAKIQSVSVDETLIDNKGKLDLKRANLLTYAHGSYYQLGGILGNFGYSIRKRKK
ncbi:MAG: flavin reductase family protein [Clostridia bacterium]